MRLLGLAALAFLAAVPALAAEPVRIKVDYVWSAVSLENGGRTPVQARLSVGATLVGNRVSDTWEGQAGRNRNSGGSEGTLGGRWQVVNQSTLMRVTDWPNSQTIVRVTVSGQTCRATVEGRLKPGRSVYVFRRVVSGRGFAEFAEPHYDNVQCSIS